MESARCSVMLDEPGLLQNDLRELEEIGFCHADSIVSSCKTHLLLRDPFFFLPGHASNQVSSFSHATAP